jgi:hypothetical protein
VLEGLLFCAAFYSNTHQDSPKSTRCEGTDTLQLAIDTRQVLGKRPPHTNQDVTKSPTSPPPAEGKRVKRPSYEGTYTSLILQVNYTEGSAHDNPPGPARALLQAPKRPVPDHSEPPTCPTTTGPRSPKKARTEAPRPLDNIPQTHVSHSPPV